MGSNRGLWIIIKYEERPKVLSPPPGVPVELVNPNTIFLPFEFERPGSRRWLCLGRSAMLSGYDVSVPWNGVGSEAD